MSREAEAKPSNAAPVELVVEVSERRVACPVRFGKSEKSEKVVRGAGWEDNMYEISSAHDQSARK